MSLEAVLTSLIVLEGVKALRHQCNSSWAGFFLFLHYHQDPNYLTKVMIVSKTVKKHTLPQASFSFHLLFFISAPCVQVSMLSRFTLSYPIEYLLQFCL